MAELFLGAAACLTLLIAACGAAIPGRDRLTGLVLLQAAGNLAVLALLLASRAFGQGYLFTTAVVLAVTALPGTYLYAHFFERWR